jgi:glycosyltransferase involved in cell wall biosynthesis
MDKTKIKTLFILPDLSGNGAVRATLNVLRRLDRRQFEIILFVLARRGACLSEVPSDIKLVVAHKRRRYESISFKYLMPYYIARLLWEASSCDIIIGASELHPAYLAYAAAVVLRKPSVGWVQVPLDRWLKQEARYWHNIAARFIYPRLTGVVCVSKACKQSMSKVARIMPERLRVIYSAYESTSIIEKSKERCPDWAVNVIKKPTLIALGRMSYEKGFDLLIRAHAKVLKRSIDHNLLILGSGLLRDKLRELSTHLGVSGSVFMPGYVDNPYPLLKNATAFVLSSRYEGFPAVVFEALSLGTPVVATACGGPAEILSDGENGILVLPEDVNSLADGIYNILSNGELRERLATPDIEQLGRYSLENIVTQWEQLLMEIATRC